ncbi:hypothetical protein HDU96_009094 [Phlyctochytrium bullatum]|nr:hypothetical protein HDU96_009094 [Phlyctochytrium bullatum]
MYTRLFSLLIVLIACALPLAILARPLESTSDAALQPTTAAAPAPDADDDHGWMDAPVAPAPTVTPSPPPSPSPQPAPPAAPKLTPKPKATPRPRPKANQALDKFGNDMATAFTRVAAAMGKPFADAARIQANSKDMKAQWDRIRASAKQLRASAKAGKLGGLFADASGAAGIKALAGVVNATADLEASAKSVLAVLFNTASRVEDRSKIQNALAPITAMGRDANDVFKRFGDALKLGSLQVTEAAIGTSDPAEILPRIVQELSKMAVTGIEIVKAIPLSDVVLAVAAMAEVVGAVSTGVGQIFQMVGLIPGTQQVTIPAMAITAAITTIANLVDRFAKNVAGIIAAQEAKKAAAQGNARRALPAAPIRSLCMQSRSHTSALTSTTNIHRFVVGTRHRGLGGLWTTAAVAVSGSTLLCWKLHHLRALPSTGARDASSSSSSSSPPPSPSSKDNDSPKASYLPQWRLPRINRIFADPERPRQDAESATPSKGKPPPAAAAAAAADDTAAGTDPPDSPDNDDRDLPRLLHRARRIIQKPIETTLRNLQIPAGQPLQSLQAFVQSIPTRLGRPDLADKLAEVAGRVPSPLEVSQLLRRLLTPEEWRALTTRVASEALDKALDMVVEGRMVKRVRAEMRDEEKHPEVAWEAEVRVGTGLAEEERRFVEERRKGVARALSRFLGEEVKPEDVPIIGIAASGGGCRAMVSTLGAVQGLSDLGLLDACTYMAGVSGSTWAMAQLYGVEKSARSALSHTKWALSRNLMNPLDFLDAFTGPLSELVLTGAVHRFHAPPSPKSLGIVDLFGVLLTSKFLVPQIALGAGADPLEVREVVARRLSEQVGVCEEQILPFPIYSAVTRVVASEAKARGDVYQWLEFTPFEVGFVSHARPDEGFWIPTWSFGRTFDGGKSKDRFPETEVGILLGVFGSAFSADFLRIIDEVEDILSDEARGRLKKIFKERLEVHPIAPARFPNPAYNVKDAKDPIKTHPSIPIMDSGMDNSIPFAPLLRPDRHLDIIIVVDGSRGIGSHPFLSRAESFAHRRSLHLPVPHNAKHPCVVEAPAAVAGSDAYAGPAGVVYVPLVANASYRDGRFDPAEAPFAATHNFFWTEEQVDEVAGLAAHNLKCVRGDVAELIRKVVRRKREMRLRGEGR